jgi:hypothetical protein
MGGARMGAMMGAERRHTAERSFGWRGNYTTVRDSSPDIPSWLAAIGSRAQSRRRRIRDGYSIRTRGLGDTHWGGDLCGLKRKSSKQLSGYKT